MSDFDQYLINAEPFYQPIADEIALYEAAYAERLPVMVKGPTGCGKSRFIEYMAWKLKKPLITGRLSTIKNQFVFFLFN